MVSRTFSASSDPVFSYGKGGALFNMDGFFCFSHKSFNCWLQNVLRLPLKFLG